jgi:hypothetical protein
VRRPYPRFDEARNAWVTQAESESARWTRHQETPLKLVTEPHRAGQIPTFTCTFGPGKGPAGAAGAPGGTAAGPSPGG